MSPIGRTVLGSAVTVALLLGGLCACSTNDSNGFTNTGGNTNKGGSTSTDTPAAGGKGSSTSPTANTAGTTNKIVANADAGVYVPPSTIDDTQDTYTTSCELEKCAKDEGCYDACPSGSCCVHACEGQTGTASGVVTCCDRQGGIVPGATCGS